MDYNSTAPILFSGRTDCDEFSSDAVSRFNAMAARNTGNDILKRINEFNSRNATRFTVDDEPELDQYTTTAYYGIGNESKNDPYDELKAAPEKYVASPSDYQEAADFMAAFGSVFK